MVVNMDSVCTAAVNMELHDNYCNRHGFQFNNDGNFFVVSFSKMWVFHVCLAVIFEVVQEDLLQVNISSLKIEMGICICKCWKLLFFAFFHFLYFILDINSYKKCLEEKAKKYKISYNFISNMLQNSYFFYWINW